MDPHNQSEMPTGNISRNINETLFRISQDLKIEPVLATSYKLVNDTTWEFKLRKGVKFHNGEEFNLNDRQMDLRSKTDGEP